MVMERQFSLVSRTQALELGMTERALGYKIRPGGPWQLMLPGVYLGQTGASNPFQLMMAAQLYAGPGSLITGPAAMFHHRLGARDLTTIHVLIPVARRRRSISFVQVERTTRLPDRVSRRGPLRFVPEPRAVMDTARGLGSLRDVRSVIADPVQMGRCNVRELATELNSGSVRRSALARIVLAEVGEGIRSTAEGDMLELLRTCGLPMPLLNASLYLGDTFLAMPDAWWQEAGVAAEVDSQEWHLGPAAWKKTMERHNRMTAAGVAVLHFPPSRLRTDRQAVAAELRAAYTKGRQRPALPIRIGPPPANAE